MSLIARSRISNAVTALRWCPAATAKSPPCWRVVDGEDRLQFLTAPEYRSQVIAREPGGYISIVLSLHAGRRFVGPFHGNVLTLYKPTAGGWRRSVIHDDLALGHIVWAGELLGGPALLAGSRRERRELRLYRPARDGSVDPLYQVIDDGIGPSQIAVRPMGTNRARLYIAAHGVDEVRLYDLEAFRCLEN